MPVTSQPGVSTSTSSSLIKKPDGVGGPTTWIGSAILSDNMLISNDEVGAYIGCRMLDEHDDLLGTDKVELGIDGKNQLAGIEIFCG
jgi:hypothetical protein